MSASWDEWSLVGAPSAASPWGDWKLVCMPCTTGAKPKRKRRRGCAKAKPHGRGRNQSSHRMPWPQSPFYTLYNATAVSTWGERDFRLFKLKFGVSHEVYETVVAMARTFPMDASQGRRRKHTPLWLRVLGVLEVLSSGCTFGRIEPLCGISRRSFGDYFHAFCRCVAKEREQHIFMPAPGTPLFNQFLEEYSNIGFDGCIGSMDSTTVYWGASYSERFSHRISTKAPAARRFNVTASHFGWVMNVHPSTPCAVNDKTICLSDVAANCARGAATAPQDYTVCQFTLLHADGSTSVCTGLWIMVDGGYTAERCFPCAFGHYSDCGQHKVFSSRLGSTRKDIECLFGRKKRRFAILRMGMTYASKQAVDDVFYTCAVLNNIAVLRENVAGGVEWKDAKKFPAAIMADAAPPLPEPGAVVSPGDRMRHLRERLVANICYKLQNNLAKWPVSERARKVAEQRSATLGSPAQQAYAYATGSECDSSDYEAGDDLAGDVFDDELFSSSDFDDY